MKMLCVCLFLGGGKGLVAKDEVMGTVLVLATNLFLLSFKHLFVVFVGALAGFGELEVSPVRTWRPLVNCHVQNGHRSGLRLA